MAAGGKGGYMMQESELQEEHLVGYSPLELTQVGSTENLNCLVRERLKKNCDICHF